MTETGNVIVEFPQYAEFFYENFDVTNITMVDLVKMVQKEYSDVYPGRQKACVYLAIDEIAKISYAGDGLDYLVSYIGSGLSNLKPDDFNCIFSALSPSLIESAAMLSGRCISFVPLALLNDDECKKALSPISSKLTDTKKKLLDQISRFALGHPRSIAVIGHKFEVDKSITGHTLLNACCDGVVHLFQKLHEGYLPLFIDALRGFKVPAKITYRGSNLEDLYKQGLILQFNKQADSVPLVVPPFHFLRLASVILLRELFQDKIGLFPVANLIRAIFELPPVHSTALECRCLAMTMLTMLLIDYNMSVSVLDLFVRDSTNVYTSDKFNYAPLVKSISGLDFKSIPGDFNFTTMIPMLEMPFEKMSPEQFAEQFPLGMVTGALTQTGQIAVDSIIYDCRNPAEPYAIFFENKYSSLSSVDHFISPSVMKSKYHNFEVLFKSHLTRMLFGSVSMQYS